MKEQLITIKLKIGKKFQKIFKILTNKEDLIKNQIDLELNSKSLKFFLEFSNKSFFFDLELQILEKNFFFQEKEIKKIKKTIHKKEFIKMISNIITEKDLILKYKIHEEEISIKFEQFEITTKKVFNKKKNLFFDLKFISGKIIYKLCEIFNRCDFDQNNNLYIEDFLTKKNLYADLNFSVSYNPFSFFFSAFLFGNNFEICFLKNKGIKLISKNSLNLENISEIKIFENNLIKINFYNSNEITRDRFFYHNPNIFLLKNILNGIYEKNNSQCDVKISIYLNGYIKIIFEIDEVIFKVFIASKFGN